MTFIQAADEGHRQQALQRWDNVVKPAGSLGRLEEIGAALCAITRRDFPAAVRRRILLFAADHGIVQEGVSAYPQEVTAQMVRNFLNGTAAICVLTRLSNIELHVVNMGMLHPVEDPKLIDNPIGPGTRNFLREPAMSHAELERAMAAGIAFAEKAARDGIHLLAAGDMGIGNSASAAAIYSCLMETDPDTITGCGAGLNEAGRLRKVEVLRAALNKWKIPASRPLEVLRHFGGFEIAAIAGLYLGAAASRVPVIVDGYICTAAAAAAIAVVPNSRDSMIFAHRSAENGYARVLEHFQFKPLLDLGLRLGEGTGAALAMQIVQAAADLYRNMPTFEEAAVSRKQE